MRITSNKHICLLIGFLTSLLIAAPAYAIFPKLSTTLTALATINGTKPSGNANLDQSRYPNSPGVLSVKVSKVSVPDGSILAVNLSDCPWFGPVAYVKIVKGSASVSTSLPATCQIGRSSSITLIYNNLTVMKGGSPWTI
jgi:hypothetical protein